MKPKKKEEDEMSKAIHEKSFQLKKEATRLKHIADRSSTDDQAAALDYYIQGGLKFLEAAYTMEEELAAAGRPKAEARGFYVDVSHYFQNIINRSGMEKPIAALCCTCVAVLQTRSILLRMDKLKQMKDEIANLNDGGGLSPKPKSSWMAEMDVVYSCFGHFARAESLGADMLNIPQLIESFRRTMETVRSQQTT
eukprot:TRINITY_DN15199_c0_g1_i1.p1 TRINITY_DN15199_c0_g1~~TRINITY_DN15199_c0_g1_i1.p1  ORF type:complete len:195 (+),score=58.90 TRINITY_DN15199_c0_g1_i1:3-587(+)